MPIYDVTCRDCHFSGEILVLKSEDPLVCPDCGSREMQRRMSPTSSLTGRSPRNLPGPADTGCCGRSPAEASCQGPGSCCGKTARSG